MFNLFFKDPLQSTCDSNELYSENVSRRKVKLKYKINLNSKLYEKSNNVTSHDSKNNFQSKVKIYDHDSNDSNDSSIPLDESKSRHSFSQNCVAHEKNNRSHNEFISKASNFNIGGNTNYTKLGSFIDYKSANIINIIEPILVDEKSIQVESFDTKSQSSEVLILIDPSTKKCTETTNDETFIKDITKEVFLYHMKYKT